MGQLQRLAMELGADERTLRRAVERGSVRCRRPGPRRLEVAEDERVYLAKHWELLSELRRALRTEPNVRLAVLYGSAARGDDGDGSDVDLLVSFSEDHPIAAAELALRLRRRLGRDVDVASLARADQGSPLLLLQALDEGRVVLDRDDAWSALRSRRSAVSRRAGRAFADEMTAAAAAARALIGA